MAKTILVDDLAPTTDDLYFKDVHDAEAKKAEQIQDPQQKAAQQKFVQDFFLPKSIADNEWYWWYEVLPENFILAVPLIICDPFVLSELLYDFLSVGLLLR